MIIPPSLMNLFGQSPIRPLEKHIDKAHAAARTLIPFIEAAFAKDWEKAQGLQQKICQFESQADEIKKDLRMHLPNKGLFLPVARSDILVLLNVQDSIANYAEDIAGLIIGRHMIFPQAIANDFYEFLKQCVHASSQARQAINELDELLEAGFRGSEVTIVEDMVRAVDQIEHETDTMQIDIRHKLFSEEKNLPPVDVMFLYDVIERTGNLANCAQNVGERLLILLAR